jgi:hypothetical protein
MQPINHPAYNHTALINPADGKHAVNLAILRWAGGAKQVTLTQWELPPDAVGRIYTVDVFIGDFVGVRYADWAKGVLRYSRGHGSVNNHRKRGYITAPHIHLDNLNTGERRHYRPFVHTLIAYVYPPLREQYARAALEDMTAKNRTFAEAEVQVNHLDKDTLNSSACNLEVVTAGDNIRHSRLTDIGVPFSMRLCKSQSDEYADLRDCLEVLLDAPGYVERMCHQVSAAQLPADADSIPVCIQSITGSKVKPVPIAHRTIWGILAGLYTAKAHHICV